MASKPVVVKSKSLAVTTQPEIGVMPALTTAQYRNQMKGFQDGAMGGASVLQDEFYQAGYKDGQGVRKGYSETLKKLVAPIAQAQVGKVPVAAPPNPEFSNTRSDLSLEPQTSGASPS